MIGCARLHLLNRHQPSFSASAKSTSKQRADTASPASKSLIPLNNSSRQLKHFFVTIKRKSCRSNSGTARLKCERFALAVEYSNVSIDLLFITSNRAELQYAVQDKICS